MNYSRPVFIVRMSAIGDVVIAAKNVQYFIKNNYEPFFVSSIHMKDILLKVKDLKHFICFDEQQNPTYFLYRKKVGINDIKKYFYTQKSAENILNTNALMKRFETPVFCDLHSTPRSARAIKKIRTELFYNQKIIVNKVKRKIFYRYFLILCAWLNLSQKKRNSKSEQILNVHDLQLNTVNKIFQDGNIFQMNHSQEVYLIKDSSIVSEKKYVCVFPGASGSMKCWPKNRFKTLIELILQHSSYDIYICGGAQDPTSCIHFIDDFLCSNRVYNLVGQKSLGEILNIVSQASYVISNDSFAGHVADAYQVPATVIFGPTSPKFGFVPLSSKIQVKYLNLKCSPCSRHGKGVCRYKNLNCLNGIEPIEIFNDIMKNI